MYWLKACPKCHGDLCQGGDEYGAFVFCLQCSRHFMEVGLYTASGPGTMPIVERSRRISHRSPVKALLIAPEAGLENNSSIGM